MNEFFVRHASLPLKWSEYECCEFVTSSVKSLSLQIPGSCNFENKRSNDCDFLIETRVWFRIGQTIFSHFNCCRCFVYLWHLFVRYKSVGKLSGGQQAAVMALAIDDTDTADGNICVVTGSKDHYIKVCLYSMAAILFCYFIYKIELIFLLEILREKFSFLVFLNLVKFIAAK